MRSSFWSSLFLAVALVSAFLGFLESQPLGEGLPRLLFLLSTLFYLTSRTCDVVAGWPQVTTTRGRQARTGQAALA